MEAHFWFNVKCMGRGASHNWGHKVSDCGLYGFYCMSVYGPNAILGGSQSDVLNSEFHANNENS